MLKYIIKKIIFTCIVLVGAATCAFLLLHAIPGDTAEALAGPQATVEDVDNLRRAMDVGRILRTFKIKKNVEVTDNGKIII